MVCESLLRAGIRLCLLLVVIFQEVMLLLVQSRLDVAGAGLGYILVVKSSLCRVW